jgi:hypothetical protein
MPPFQYSPSAPLQDFYRGNPVYTPYLGKLSMTQVITITDRCFHVVYSAIPGKWISFASQSNALEWFQNQLSSCEVMVRERRYLKHLIDLS